MARSTYLENIASNVERLRKAREWSQEELGRRAGLSQKVISNLENALTHDISPTFQTISSVAEAFGISVFLLMTKITDPRLIEPKGNEPQVVSRLIDSYMSLPPGGRQTVDRILALEAREAGA